MKILIDMNLTPLWVAHFEKAKIEAVHWSQIGEQAAPDTELFLWAKENDFVVFTHDLDFGVCCTYSQSSVYSTAWLVN